MRVDRGSLEALRHKAALEVGKQVIQSLILSQALGLPSTQRQPAINPVTPRKATLQHEEQDRAGAYETPRNQGEAHGISKQVKSEMKAPKEELVMDAMWELGIVSNEEIKAEDEDRVDHLVVPDATKITESQRSKASSRPALPTKEDGPHEPKSLGAKRPKRKGP